MKRFFALLLALVLLLSASALADGVVGCWAHYELLTTGCPSIPVIISSSPMIMMSLVSAAPSSAPGRCRPTELFSRKPVIIPTPCCTSLRSIRSP